MDFFRQKRAITPSYLLLTLQRAYEDAYQSSVRAILLETRDQPADALAAWKRTLKTISAHMATVTETPKAPQEIDLMTNIMNIEKQCHDRISFLERGWPDTNPYASYSLIDSDEYIATNSGLPMARASTTNVNLAPKPATTSSPVSPVSTNSSSPSSSSSFYSMASSNQQKQQLRAKVVSNPNVSASSASTSKGTLNPFSTTAPVLFPISSTTTNTSHYSKPSLLTPNNTDPEYSFSSSSSFSSSDHYYYPELHEDSPQDQKPPPIPPKISLDYSDNSTTTDFSAEAYQSRLDPGSSSAYLIDLSSTSTTPVASTSALPLPQSINPPQTSRASPKRKPVDSSENLLDMSRLASNGQSTATLGHLPHKSHPPPPPPPPPPPSSSSSSSSSNKPLKLAHPKPVQASSTPILAHHPRTATPPKAASTSSLSSTKSSTPPTPTNVDQQFANLSLGSRRTPSPSSHGFFKHKESQEPSAASSAPRTMLKTLRNHQKLPRKIMDERKAASAHAATLAWGPHKQDRAAHNQQISLMAANISSTQARNAGYYPQVSSSSANGTSTSSKVSYNKPTVFKAPVIHAPVTKQASHQRTSSATHVKSTATSASTQHHQQQQQQRRAQPKFIIDKKPQTPPAQPKHAAPTTKAKATRTNGAASGSSSTNTNTNTIIASTTTPTTPAHKQKQDTPEPAQEETSSSSASDDAEFDSDENDEDEEEAWLQKARATVKKIKGIDQNAADQIFNDVVVKGDPVVWNDIAGLEKAKSSLKEAVVYPFLRPDLFSGLREPAQGMLLFGPPGTGKTMLARAVATESKSTFFSISASSLTSKFLGESEKLVRALFLMAKALAPSIIFVDEIDSLLSARSDTGENESSRRIKTEFLIQWSALQHAAAGKEHDDVTRVLVLGATNLPWVIDEAARRRFVRRQYIPLPEPETRRYHLEKLLSRQKHSISEVEMNQLVELTDSFSGSDITALAKDAAMGPLRALGEALLTTPQDQIRPLGFADFKASLETIRPSVSKESLKVFEDWAEMYGSSGA
ncbi:uncharacterized protein SAPINGB_P005870 [Magnusiomyces paraingens]|uniref:AAA+ ATPase domain-containing protein n=1 Tax=Magnusiomyces paraingens TaxID=2606893 RepID=A0A5E8C1M1_9ASCO|nr:uncharacterized protein SAPINGB_P005870 [Saprochaete ingens]VVT57789.1 unnamed protein product [Saprochaete ingens]